VANGISALRSIKFEVGFGVCLYGTKIVLGLPAKPLIDLLIAPPEQLFLGYFFSVGYFMIVYLFCSCLVEESLFGSCKKR
jgi:hypothetical protein